MLTLAGIIPVKSEVREGSNEVMNWGRAMVGEDNKSNDVSN